MDSIHRIEATEDRLEEANAYGEHEAPRHQEDRRSSHEQAELDVAILTLSVAESEPGDQDGCDHSDGAEPAEVRAGESERRSVEVPVGSAAGEATEYGVHCHTMANSC